MASPTSWLGHLGRAGGADGVLDLLGEQLQLVLVDRPALAGPAHAGDDLGAVERLADPAALDDGEHRLLDGGEPAAALRAGPTAAGGRPLVGLPRVDDPAVGVVAERAAHRRFTSSRPGRRCPDAVGRPGRPVDPPGDIRWMSRGEPEDRACGRAYNSVTTRCRGTLGRATQDVQAIRRSACSAPTLPSPGRTSLPTSHTTRRGDAPERVADGTRRRADPGRAPRPTGVQRRRRDDARTATEPRAGPTTPRSRATAGRRRRQTPVSDPPSGDDATCGCGRSAASAG